MEYSRQEYLKLFAGEGRQGKALEIAHDIRKFEIELYWKRATYFWTFIAVAFAGFFAASTQADLSNTYVIGCLGLSFSVGWYLVNRASSAWQRNWEVHVDLLEDEVTGPLHKTLVSREAYNIWDLAGPYRFSPSRLNAILSLQLVLVWLVLMLRTIVRIWKADGGFTSVVVFSVLTAAIVTTMVLGARSGWHSSTKVPHLRQRRYAETPEDVRQGRLSGSDLSSTAVPGPPPPISPT